jgi:hypothetical protein
MSIKILARAIVGVAVFATAFVVGQAQVRAARSA